MTRIKGLPRVGDTAWFVEWCSKLAFYDDDPSGDVDRDRCTMTTRRVGSREEAEALAREVYPEAAKTLGVVDYWFALFVPYDEGDRHLYPGAGHWMPTTNSETYDGD